MCNDYRLELETSKVFEDFANLKIKIRLSEGAPNIEARQDIKITDTAPIVRMIEGEPGYGRSRAVAVELATAERQAGLQFSV